MIRILIRLLGVVVAAESVFLASRGFDAYYAVTRLEGSVVRTESALVGHRTPQDVGEKQLADYRQEIAVKKTEGIIWFVVASTTLLAGILMMLLPSYFRPPRKKKGQASLPAPDQESTGWPEDRRATPAAGAEPAPERGTPGS